MKILIINAHWYNRGDEAALRAMIDELVAYFPSIQIKVHIIGGGGEYFPYQGSIQELDGMVPAGGRIRWIDFWFRYITRGRIGFRIESSKFMAEIEDSDFVLHSPGGPSIGDIYKKTEFEYLCRLMLVRRLKKHYAFYAPSMGPFKNKKNDWIRKRILNSADFIAVREPISAHYLKEYGVDDKVIVTLDSAFQHPIDVEKYGTQFQNDNNLRSFIEKYDIVIGVTITDLMWNPKYAGKVSLSNNINKVFKEFVNYLNELGYGVVFIPQLFGKGNDEIYMRGFASEDCYVLPECKENDCYYQQYVISRMYAVIGMRYHSNIFAAKMGTPFISISYEQKMSGFMEKANLLDYCIDITKLSAEKLKDTFEKLCRNYKSYSNYLQVKRVDWQKEAHKTTEMVEELIGRL